MKAFTLRASRVGSGLAAVFFAVGFAFPQQGVGAQATSRAEEIQMLRREKAARLWPERQSPIVDQVNKLVERGLLDGASSGKGANGPQLIMGGMRSGQGMSVGVGYRRSDWFHDRLGFRGTARGTLEAATMLDLELDFQSLRTEHSFLTAYAKYENSPQMDFYGLGSNSQREDRSSYRLEDFTVTVEGGTKLFNRLTLAALGGYYRVHTGSGKRSGFPSSDEVFTDDVCELGDGVQPPGCAPGLRRDTDFFGLGGLLAWDHRDNPRGPRSGGYYKVRYLTLNDRRLDEFGFETWYFGGQQYIPYFNKTRVFAFRIQAVLTFPRSGQRIPFYAMPVVGGNDTIRGFDRYRFIDRHSLLLSAEHRWHGFSGMDVALFVDAGTVASRKADVDFSGLRTSGGIGFRFRLKDAVIMRIDFAGSEEGFRFMWTFSDIFVSDRLREW